MILPGPPPAPLWKWVFDNLDELGFRYDEQFGCRRGKYQGKPFFIFEAEPFRAHIDGGGVVDLCEILADLTGTTPDEIRHRFRESYEKAHGGSPSRPQGSGDPYSQLASETRKEFGYR